MTLYLWCAFAFIFWKPLSRAIRMAIAYVKRDNAAIHFHIGKIKEWGVAFWKVIV